MRIQLKFMLAMLAGASTMIKAEDVYGHTFFSIRPPFQSHLPEKEAQWHGGGSKRALARENGWHGAFQAVVFGGRSTKEKDLAKFFSPAGQETLRVLGGVTDPTASYLDRDINPLHFNVQHVDAGAAATYSSDLTFRPRQSFAGVGFDYVQYLGWNCGCDPRWWFEISFPVVWVRNNMNLVESNLTSTGLALAGTNTTLEQAFAGGVSFGGTGTLLQYGKIDGSRKKTGVADVEIKLGYDYMCSDDCYLSGYVGFVAPTGNRPNAEYVFEPIIGNNRHWGIMWGGSMGFEVWSNCDRALFFEFASNCRYLFKGTERRSFDLKARPWSRYMAVYATQADAAAAAADPGTLSTVTNGINVFTRDLSVTPGFMRDFNTALVYSSCGFEAELGYNFYARQCERVRLKEDWVIDPSVAFLAGTAAAPFLFAPDGNIDPLSNIFNDNTYGGNTGVDATTAALIRESDLALESAAHPCVISNIVYGSLGYAWNDLCYPVFVGLGGSYEFARSNAVLNRWMVWGKFGFSI